MSSHWLKPFKRVMADFYSRVIYYDEVKDHQVRLTVNTFRDVDYIHLRKYYMDFDGEWMPSSEGISMPITLDNSRELFTGLVELLSLSESKEIIIEYFSELIKGIYVD
jgi:hypothetical protein